MSVILNAPVVFLIVIVLAVAGYFLGRKRAMDAADNDVRNLHSLPTQYGWHVALATFIPAALLLALWSFLSGLASNIYAGAIIPDDQPELQPTLNEINNLTDREIEIAVGNRRVLFTSSVKSLASAIDGYVENGNATNEEAEAWRADFLPLARAASRRWTGGQHPGVAGHAQRRAGPAPL